MYAIYSQLGQRCLHVGDGIKSFLKIEISNSNKYSYHVVTIQSILSSLKLELSLVIKVVGESCS